MHDIKLWVNFNNPKEVMFVTTDNPLWLYYLNLVVIVLPFTKEFALTWTGSKT
jgi:hypothetical protein